MDNQDKIDQILTESEKVLGRFFCFVIFWIGYRFSLKYLFKCLDNYKESLKHFLLVFLSINVRKSLRESPHQFLFLFFSYSLLAVLEKWNLNIS